MCFGVTETFLPKKIRITKLLDSNIQIQLTGKMLAFDMTLTRLMIRSIFSGILLGFSKAYTAEGGLHGKARPGVSLAAVFPII